ncbi:hypothetical protein L2E82_14505 [Cichorium intybus]|uniref:Uncharacterized protein n=1 Tax=Cichorium intybus TaxID=13427 RepID=A0ACB9F0L5_CICIN|nr:hypothetical protein L2E82_14505 [Cichorium intybus]
MGLSAGPAHTVYFSVYEMCKGTFSRHHPNILTGHVAAGVFATVASDAVFTSMDMVKQRLKLGSGSLYKGVLDYVRIVLKEKIFGAFYASYRTTILMNAPFTTINFATYEAAKKGLLGVSLDSSSDERLVVHATAGAATGALVTDVTTPLHVVKTQFSVREDVHSYKAQFFSS